MSRRRIRLHIDQIVLQGVDPGDKRAFDRALRTELARLLALPSASADLGSSREVGQIEAGKVGGDSKGRGWGRDVAQVVFKGVAS